PGDGTTAPPPSQPAAPTDTGARGEPGTAAGAEDDEIALAPPTRSAVKPVRFLIASEPSGASVTYRGKVLGPTPLNLEVSPEEDGRARAELTFTLDGYQRVTAVAEGEGVEARINQKLQPRKKAGSKAGKASSSSAYKEDPY
ncbi:PEGA domain-containing protein, partial [Pyxidicoccus sp. 3LG]